MAIHLQEPYIPCEIYKMRFFGQTISVTVTSNPQSVRNWIRKSIHIHRHRLRSHHRCSVIVGLGIQWYPYERDPHPATIQVSIGRRVLIFQLLRCRSIHTALYRFLTDHRITFVGYNIGYDCRLLRKFYGLNVNSTVELRSVSGMKNAAMSKMVEKYLGFYGLEKDRRVGTSDWEAVRLSSDQVEYASLDAYLSFLLGVELVAKRRGLQYNAAFGDDALTSGYYAGHKLYQDEVYESGWDLDDFEDQSYSDSIDRVYEGGAVTSGFYAHEVFERGSGLDDVAEYYSDSSESAW